MAPVPGHHFEKSASRTDVGETVEISIGSELIRTHPIRRDRTREHGALANPDGGHAGINPA